jgi:hypothetical protein
VPFNLLLSSLICIEWLLNSCQIAFFDLSLFLCTMQLAHLSRACTLLLVFVMGSKPPRSESWLSVRMKTMLGGVVVGWGEEASLHAEGGGGKWFLLSSGDEDEDAAAGGAAGGNGMQHQQQQRRRRPRPNRDPHHAQNCIAATMYLLFYTKVSCCCLCLHFSCAAAAG